MKPQTTRISGAGAPVLVAGLTLLVAQLAASCGGTQDPRPGRSDDGPSTTDDGPGGQTGTGGRGQGGEFNLGGSSAVEICGEAPDTSGAFSKKALLAAAADCSAYQACGFRAAAVVLQRELKGWAQDPSGENLGRARAAYDNAMNEWSSIEGLQFGPVADGPVDEYHGRGIRTKIHPWPSTNRCNVETQISTQEYASADGFKYVPPSGRGLFAIEYVLFTNYSDTVCAANQQAYADWNALSSSELAAAKRSYAVAVASDVVRLADTLVGVWAPDGENFKAKLLAFDGYGSEQETLNIVAWSLIYPEAEIKDWKLGPFSTVPVTPASIGPETPYSLRGIENLRVNLRAFEMLFWGCRGGEGLGFDDWLTEAGAADLRDDIRAAYEQAALAADAFPAMQDATTAEFDDFYRAIKPLADLLKSSFFGSGSPLNLKLPASAGSDTD